MMPRATHKGAVGFGMVHVPVELYTATQDNDIHFNQLCKGNIYENDGIFTASSWAMTLENGGVASACVNYLHPKHGFGIHGNESVRIFGTEGMIEITGGARNTHFYTLKEDK